MENIALFYWTAALGAIYVYCLLRTHFLAVKVSRGTFLPRAKCGEIRLADLRYAQTSAFDPEDARDAHLAGLYLRTGNLVAVSYPVIFFLQFCFKI